MNRSTRMQKRLEAARNAGFQSKGSEVGIPGILSICKSMHESHVGSGCPLSEVDKAWMTAYLTECLKTWDDFGWILYDEAVKMLVIATVREKW